MQIADISFPIYKLGVHKPIEEDGVVLFLNQYGKEGKPVITIVDDTTQVGETLAKRRLQLMKQDAPLFKLRNAIFFLADLIKIAKSSNIWFIDSRGRPFQYKKSKNVDLIFKKILQILPIPTGGSIVQVADIEQRFKTLSKITTEYKYAGLLEINSKSYVLYGVYETKPKDTRRKI
jgi:hypothetical protein